MKTCSSCQQSLPITEFYFMSKKNAFDPRCKSCKSIYQKEYYKTKIVPENKGKVYREKYRKSEQQLLEESQIRAKKRQIKLMADKARKVVANRSTYRTLPDREIFIMNKYWILDYPNFRYHYGGFFDDFDDSDWKIEKWAVC